MLAKERQDRILAEVRRRGGVRIGELTEMLGVSDMTIRRDFETLAQFGLVQKVHGGAVDTCATAGPSTDEPGFDVKSYRQQAEKEAIAAEGARLVRPGTAVGVSAGTTTWALARHLRDIPELTVVTNSVPVAEVLRASGRADLNVVLSGGYRTRSDALVGPVADAAIRSLHVDLLFLGVHGMDRDQGFTTPNLMEAETDRALLKSTRRLVVLADHTKWGVVGLSTIATLREADVIVTDDGLRPDARAELAEQVGELIVARIENARQGAG